MEKGTWFKKLVAARMSVMAIPADGTLADGVKFLSDRKRVQDTARVATEWARAAVEKVLAAPDCPYGGPEEVARAVLARLGAVEDVAGRGT